METGPTISTFTYETTPTTKVNTTEISGPIVETTTNTTILSATDQIAAYFAEDLAAFVTKTHLNLREALKAPPQFGTDSNLFLQLICADINRLLSDQLILGIMLVLSDPVENDENRFTVQYRAVYQLKHSQTLRGEGDEGMRATVRTGDGVDPPRHVGNQARLHLLAHWSSASSSRAELIKYPRYHFLWVPTSHAKFDDGDLAPAYQDSGMSATEGEWMVNRIEQATPESPRR